MSNIVITGATASITFADTGDFESDGKFITGTQESAIIGGPEYGRDFPSTAGTDGAGSKNFGFRNRRLEVRGFYVGASENAVTSTIDTDMNAMGADGKLTVQIGGITYNRCFFDAAASAMTKTKGSGFATAKVFAEVRYVFNSKGL